MERDLATRIGIILQARTGSARLPGKVLKEIEGKPMLWHIIERLKKVKKIDEIVVATSNNMRDREIIELTKLWGNKSFMGSEEDVLDRFYQAAKEFRFKQIVRATGDNPLIDPEGAERLIDLHLRTNADYSSNTTELGSGLPVGAGVEIFSFTALERSWFEGTEEDHREHVNEYILQNRNRFNVQVLEAPKDKCAAHLRFTVDTMEDFDFIAEIYHHLYTPGHIISVGQVIQYLADRRNREKG